MCRHIFLNTGYLSPTLGVAPSRNTNCATPTRAMVLKNLSRTAAPTPFCVSIKPKNQEFNVIFAVGNLRMASYLRRASPREKKNKICERNESTLNSVCW